MATRSLSWTNVVILALSCVGALTACAPSNGERESQVGPTRVPPTEFQVGPTRALPIEFADNMQSFEPESADERALLAIIVNSLRPGLERLDLGQIEPVLASKYEFQYVPAATKLLSEPRETFLESRRDWTGKAGKVREIAYAIQDVKIDQSQTIGAVIAYTTYQSKYFSPYFLETLLFEKEMDHWVLLRQTMVSIVPANPADLQVDIFLAKPQRDLLRRFAKVSLSDGVDFWLDQFLQKGRDGILTDRRETSVLFVFRVPPAVGTKINIEHRWRSRKVRHPPPKKLHYVVKSSQPYFMIKNSSWVGCCEGDRVTYKVFVNGIKIAERTVVVRR